MKKTISLLLILFCIGNSYCQKHVKRDSLTYAKHTLDLCFSEDNALSIYGYSSMGTKYYHYYFGYLREGFPMNRIRGECNYSLGMKYTYNLIKNLGFTTGIYFSKQSFSLGSNPIIYRDSTFEHYDYYTSYFTIPIGIKLSFINKFFMKPFISIDMICGFLLHEKAYVYTHTYKEIFPLMSNKIRYYFLKPQLAVGCDFYVKKRYKFSIECDWHYKAFNHADNALAPRFKYTNLNFGASFGYVLQQKKRK